MNLKELFERYILEKQYITGLSACTINNYRRAFDAFRKHGQTDTITRESLDNFVITCRKVSMTPRTLNSYIVNLNVFLGWLSKTATSLKPATESDFMEGPTGQESGR